MATLKDVKRLKALCEKYDLEGREILDKFTNTELQSVYNGIGPESFPDWLSGLVNTLHPTLEPAAFIHDAEWALSDGTEASFTASNARFKRNGYKAAKAEFGWWRPRRYLVMNDARRYGNYCQLFGWSAWCAPYDERRKVEGQA